MYLDIHGEVSEVRTLQHFFSHQLFYSLCVGKPSHPFSLLPLSNSSGIAFEIEFNSDSVL